MNQANPFPESEQKQYLRRLHLAYLATRKKSLGRPLHYFGLPSAEMRDVQVWLEVLDRIVAVERDRDLVLPMLRNARDLGIRDRLIVLEQDLSEVSRLLAMDSSTASTVVAQLPPTLQRSIQKARSFPSDIINLDLCGGFLYPDDEGESLNLQVLQGLLKFQARYSHPFILLMTFNLRDTGASDYDAFIDEALAQLEKHGGLSSTVREYFTSEVIPQQPRQLRRLRFCVPVYLHKLAFENYQVRSLGNWQYKTFYHSALFFESRDKPGALGRSWPPTEEVKELLRTPMLRLDVDTGGLIQQIDLPVPEID